MIYSIPDWIDIDSSNIDQMIRISNAKDLEKKVIEFNESVPFMMIKGRAQVPYEVSLSMCSCPDFAFQHEPCKHMYCLAGKLGMLKDVLPKLDKNNFFNARKELEKYTKLFDEGKIDLNTYINIGKILKKCK